MKSEDLIRREDALDAIDEIESEVADGDGFQYEKWRQYFCELPSAEPESCEYWDAESNYCALNRPSAQPEPEEFEWCTGCKEYDQEAHCCHRWTKAIRNTIEEIKNAQPEPRWIPVTERLPMINTIALITTSKGIVIQVMYFGENMNGHKVWRSFGGEYVYWDEEVVAWMPLPEPYERSEDAEID